LLSLTCLVKKGGDLPLSKFTQHTQQLLNDFGSLRRVITFYVGHVALELFSFWLCLAFSLFLQQTPLLSNSFKEYSLRRGSAILVGGFPFGDSERERQCWEKIVFWKGLVDYGGVIPQFHVLLLKRPSQLLMREVECVWCVCV